jgi:alpha-D-ribose 1-methylphosphonate 5-triphosphate synthase subunit PhnH
VTTLDPVAAQQVFRVLLHAVASPGELPRLPAIDRPAYEAPLHCLLDRDVAFAVVGRDAEKVERCLAEATGAPSVDPGGADFVLVLGDDSRVQMQELKAGSLAEPEEAATALYVVDRLTESRSGPLALTLSGPGVAGTRTISVTGLARGELEGIRASRDRYPKGVDVLMVDRDGTVLGLPRSTRIDPVTT